MKQFASVNFIQFTFWSYFFKSRIPIWKVRLHLLSVFFSCLLPLLKSTTPFSNIWASFIFYWVLPCVPFGFSVLPCVPFILPWVIWGFSFDFLQVPLAFPFSLQGVRLQENNDSLCLIVISLSVWFFFDSVPFQYPCAFFIISYFSISSVSARAFPRATQYKHISFCSVSL